MREYDRFSHIEDNSHLALLFNEIFSKLDVVRLVSAPATFELLESKKQDFRLFHETCLWEMYLHGVIEKLNHWIETLDEYESEFNSSWEYYASSKRIEAIKDYGGDEGEYDDNGYIRTQGLTHDDLRYYTVTHDLVQDDWRDIVQETTPEQLGCLTAALERQAKVSFAEIFKKVFKQDLPAYKQDKDGNMVKMSFSDHAMQKASDEALADSLSSVVLCVCRSIQLLVKRMRELDPFNDNRDELMAIRNDVSALLNLNFTVH